MMSCAVILSKYDAMLEVNKILMTSCTILLSRYDAMLEVEIDTLIHFNDIASRVIVARPSGKSMFPEKVF